ncbi:MAG: TonB family protein [Candidatus Binatia bacterium]
MNQHASSLTQPSPWPLTLPGPMLSLTHRRYGSAWIISGVVHGLLIVVGLWGGTRILETPRPTIRLVFVEPPPPPSVPLGAPVTEPVLPAPQPSPPVVEQPKERVHTKPTKLREPERRTLVTKKKPIAKPKPRQPEPSLPPQPEVAPAPPPVVAAAPAGVVTGATAGNDKGVVGGGTGGHAGGVIGGRGTAPLPVDQVAKPPLLLSRVMPDYPRHARRRGIEGLVLLEAILDRDGRIEDEISVLQSIPLLDEAAIQAVRRWRFRPARGHDNQPVRVILEVPVRFVLK